MSQLLVTFWEFIPNNLFSFKQTLFCKGFSQPSGFIKPTGEPSPGYHPSCRRITIAHTFSFQNYIFTIIFNSTMVHSVPVLMNIVSNLLLRNLNVTESIQIWSNPFVQVGCTAKITPEYRVGGRASLGWGRTAEPCCT